jgi:hypothetical protein
MRSVWPDVREARDEAAPDGLRRSAFTDRDFEFGISLLALVAFVVFVLWR